MGDVICATFEALSFSCFASVLLVKRKQNSRHYSLHYSIVMKQEHNLTEFGFVI